MITLENFEHRDTCVESLCDICLYNCKNTDEYSWSECMKFINKKFKSYDNWEAYVTKDYKLIFGRDPPKNWITNHGE